MKYLLRQRGSKATIGSFTAEEIVKGIASDTFTECLEVQLQSSQSVNDWLPISNVFHEQINTQKKSFTPSAADEPKVEKAHSPNVTTPFHSSDPLSLVFTFLGYICILITVVCSLYLLFHQNPLMAIYALLSGIGISMPLLFCGKVIGYLHESTCRLRKIEKILERR